MPIDPPELLLKFCVCLCIQVGTFVRSGVA